MNIKIGSGILAGLMMASIVGTAGTVSAANSAARPQQQAAGSWLQYMTSSVPFMMLLIGGYLAYKYGRDILHILGERKERVRDAGFDTMRRKVGRDIPKLRSRIASWFTLGDWFRPIQLEEANGANGVNAH